MNRREFITTLGIGALGVTVGAALGLSVHEERLIGSITGHPLGIACPDNWLEGWTVHSDGLMERAGRTEFSTYNDKGDLDFPTVRYYFRNEMIEAITADRKITA